RGAAQHAARHGHRSSALRAHRLLPIPAVRPLALGGRLCALHLPSCVGSAATLAVFRTGVRLAESRRHLPAGVAVRKPRRGLVVSATRLAHIDGCDEGAGDRFKAPCEVSARQHQQTTAGSRPGQRPGALRRHGHGRPPGGSAACRLPSYLLSQLLTAAWRNDQCVTSSPPPFSLPPGCSGPNTIRRCCCTSGRYPAALSCCWRYGPVSSTSTFMRSTLGRVCRASGHGSSRKS